MKNIFINIWFQTYFLNERRKLGNDKLLQICYSDTKFSITFSIDRHAISQQQKQNLNCLYAQKNVFILWQKVLLYFTFQILWLSNWGVHTFEEILRVSEIANFYIMTLASWLLILVIKGYCSISIPIDCISIYRQYFFINLIKKYQKNISC